MVSGEWNNYYVVPRIILSCQRLSIGKNVNSVNFIHSKILLRILRIFIYVSLQSSPYAVHRAA
jgi:hypothetical protein